MVINLKMKIFHKKLKVIIIQYIIKNYKELKIIFKYQKLFWNKIVNLNFLKQELVKEQKKEIYI